MQTVGFRGQLSVGCSMFSKRLEQTGSDVQQAPICQAISQPDNWMPVMSQSKATQTTFYLWVAVVVFEFLNKELFNTLQGYKTLKKKITKMMAKHF